MAVDNASYLMQFVDETSFYNRIVLSHLLPASLWEPLPHFLQTWLRNYFADYFAMRREDGRAADSRAA